MGGAADRRGDRVRVLVLGGEWTEHESIAAELQARGCEVIGLGAAFAALRALEAEGQGPPAPVRLAPTGVEGFDGLPYARAKEEALRRFERAYVEAQLHACGDNISAAARRAGMDRSNFKRLLRKYRHELAPSTPIDDDLAIG